MKERLNKLWPYPQRLAVAGEFARPESVCILGKVNYPRFAQDIRQIGNLRIDNNADYSILLQIDSKIGRDEGYRLTMGGNETIITGNDDAGLVYGVQTLLQILDLCKQSDGKWPEIQIEDWPTYRKRSFMVDMGRSAFNLPMLKRIVRILMRLKMNQLHLHLYDDELCGIRFENLPFGHENPFAITIAELVGLVNYAAKYHVEIVPELEGWGHVGSLVYHRKDLCGGKGMYGGGYSFLICEKTFELMSEFIRQIAAVLPQKATIHLGLDEAKWYLCPSMPKDFTPSLMIKRYYDILQQVADDQKKKLTLRIWADHAGRPVPDEITNGVIIEPWQYWIANAQSIDKAIERYSGRGKMRWIAGAGQSQAQTRGVYHATRYWCKNAINSPNIEGVNITFWGANDLVNKMITLFAGSYYIWNPFSPMGFADIDDYEAYDHIVFPIMRWWQGVIPDAFPDKIKRDQGPLVNNGFYLWGKKHKQPAAPTAPFANTQWGHDFINE